MAWVWGAPREIIEFGANMDYDMSTPMTGYEAFSDTPVDVSLRQVFRSRNSARRFRAMHSPPIGIYPVVDKVWKEIILNFVSADKVQFLPIHLIARGEICDDFCLVISLERVLCIDINKSEFSSKIVRSDITMIYGLGRAVHFNKCLNGLHLARDNRAGHHMLVSNELKEALAATGESSGFRWCEEQ